MDNNVEVLDTSINNNIDDKKGNNKIIYIIMIIIVIGLLIFGLYKFTNIFGKTVIKDSSSSANNKEIILKEITYELGDKINTDISYYVEDIVDDLNTYTLDIISIPLSNGEVNTIGDYEYRLNKGSNTFKGTVHVVDTIAPIVNTKKLYKNINEISNLKATDFVVNTIDKSKSVKIEFSDTQIDNIRSNGLYKIGIKATDTSGNITQTNTSLTITNNILNPLTDLNVSYNNLYDNEFNQIYAIKFSEAVKEDSFLYSNANDSVKSVDWLNVVKTRYPDAIANDSIEVMNVYNQYNYIIGIAIRTTIVINNNKKTVYLSN